MKDLRVFFLFFRRKIRRLSVIICILGIWNAVFLDVYAEYITLALYVIVSVFVIVYIWYNIYVDVLAYMYYNPNVRICFMRMSLCVKTYGCFAVSAIRLCA